MVKPYNPLYSVEEAADELGITRNLMYDLMNTGQIPYLILKGKTNTGSRKIRGSDLERFIEEHPVEVVVAV